MKSYDWIVVGGGITGAALSYELAKTGCSVLLLEQHATAINATRYSYGGLAYWAGTNQLTRQICQEGITRYRILSEELESDIQFRELDLLLTIPLEHDPKAVAAEYTKFAIPPQLISVAEACTMEPLLNGNACSGALTVKHGSIHPEKTTQAYIKAFFRSGGVMQITQVIGLQQANGRVTGVKTTTGDFSAANIVVCAGGFSRALLKSANIAVNLYFTHAEMIEIPPVEVQLHTLVMPAKIQRFELEAEASKVETDSLWDKPGLELGSPILDAGAIQFLDGSLRLGQISRVLTEPNATINSMESEAAIRSSVGKVLPALQNLPGTWHRCLVSFSNNLSFIGAIPGTEGIYLFSGLSNSLVSTPPLAQRFAKLVAT